MINIVVSSDPRYPVNKFAIQSTILEIMQSNNIRGNVEIGISVVGDRKMHQFNKKYRGIDSTTNILSFALEDLSPQNLQHVPRVGFVAAPDKVLRLGDILLSYPQVVEDAAIEGVSIDDELRFLVEHGVKHLLGIHHE